MTALITEFPFVLKLGYADESGDLHKEGTMRPRPRPMRSCCCATAAFSRTRATSSIILLLARRDAARHAAHRHAQGHRGPVRGGLRRSPGDVQPYQRAGKAKRSRGARPKCNHAFEFEVDTSRDHEGYPLDAMHEEIAFSRTMSLRV